MIDEDRTMQLYGYYSNELSRKSGKPIIAVCEGCGLVRTTSKHIYRDLCLQCASKESDHHLSPEAKRSIGDKNRGENNGMYGVCGDRHHNFGKHPSEESLNKMRASALNMSPEKRQKIKDATPPPSQETRDKIGKANLGRVQSEEEKRKRAESNRGQTRTEDIKRMMSAVKQGIPIGDWTGYSRDDPNDLTKAIYLNDPHPGCVRHHLTKTLVLYIPKELHEHIPHALKTGHNMGEINMLAIQYVVGWW